MESQIVNIGASGEPRAFGVFEDPEYHIPSWATVVTEAWANEVKTVLYTYFKEHQLLLLSRSLTNPNNFLLTMKMSTLDDADLIGEGKDFRECVKTLYRKHKDKLNPPSQLYIAFIQSDNDHLIDTMIELDSETLVIQCKFVDTKSPGLIL